MTTNQEEQQDQQQDIFELYSQDPDKADEEVFGRVPHADRRGFLKGAGLSTMVALLGGFIPFHRMMPAGMIPVALAEAPFSIEGKNGLTILNNRPVNAETPVHLLDDDLTPVNRHFIRNNGIPPTNMDAKSWMLTIDGEVNNPLKLSIDDLKSQFETVSLQLQLECGGNGRSFFSPKAKGNQWTLGAVACSKWTGVRLADVIKAA